MKKLAVLLLVSLLTINYVNAAVSLDLIFEIFEPQTFFLLLAFLVILTLLSFSLTKVFKKNKAIGSVLAILISLFFVYGLYLWNIDFGNFLYDIEGALPIIILLLLILSFWKFKWKTFLVVGLFFILLEILGVGENEGVPLTIGLILVVFYAIGAFFLWLKKKKKRDREYWTGGQRPPSTPVGDPKKYNKYLSQLEKGRREEVERRREAVQQTERVRKHRAWSELQLKYDQYKTAANFILKRVGGVPRGGTSEYKQYRDCLKAMDTIRRVAGKEGIRLRA